MKDNKIFRWFTIGVYVSLYALVAVISLICSTDFFNLAHGGIMAWSLAIAFEIGQAACLVSTIVLPKQKLGMVWVMFLLLTAFQCMGNTFAAYIHLHDYEGWIELFGLVDMELIAQKRVLASISGAILPIVALGFVKCLVDYLNPDTNAAEQPKDVQTEPTPSDPVDEPNDEPVDEPNDEPNDEPVDEPVDEPNDEPEPEPQQDDAPSTDERAETPNTRITTPTDAVKDAVEQKVIMMRDVNGKQLPVNVNFPLYGRSK